MENDDPQDRVAMAKEAMLRRMGDKGKKNKQSVAQQCASAESKKKVKGSKGNANQTPTMSKSDHGYSH